MEAAGEQLPLGHTYSTLWGIVQFGVDFDSLNGTFINIEAHLGYECVAGTVHERVSHDSPETLSCRPR